MSQRLHRAQLLIEQSQRKALAKIAREEGRSISDVARELLRRGMEAREEDPAVVWRRRAKALERADRLQAEMRARRGGKPLDIDIAEFIGEMREERDAQILDSFYGHRD
jgi:hypothetical protein